jgi:hypothetical protein
MLPLAIVLGDSVSSACVWTVALLLFVFEPAGRVPRGMLLLAESRIRRSWKGLKEKLPAPIQEHVCGNPDEWIDHLKIFAAGPYVGYVERLLVFTLVVLKQFEAVGFVVAAKGFVFPGVTQGLANLVRHKAIPDAVLIAEQEKYLVGSITSIAWAVLGGVVTIGVLAALALPTPG